MINKESNMELSEEKISNSKLDKENFDEDGGLEEDEFWEEGEFIQSMSSEEMRKKRKSFNMGHNENLNYNCKMCNKQISLHNKDWHDEMCDRCFDKEVYGRDKK